MFVFPFNWVVWGGDGFSVEWLKSSTEHLKRLMYRKCRGGGGVAYGVNLCKYINKGWSKFESFVKYEV